MAPTIEYSEPGQVCPALRLHPDLGGRSGKVGTRPGKNMTIQEHGKIRTREKDKGWQDKDTTRTDILRLASPKKGKS